MTKKLEEFFNLPSASTPKEVEEVQHIIEENKEAIVEIDDAIDKIDAALPLVKELEATDSEMDALAEMATQRFEDLMDLGMNVDPRFSGVIMQTASTLLGHAITAKTAKMDKKIKVIQLQLQKAKLDYQKQKDASKASDADEESIDGKGIVLDRNALLEQILGKHKDQKS